MATLTDNSLSCPADSNYEVGNPKTGFVLSAGRTGTLFLTQLLRDYFPQLRIEHEPFPGRYELLLGNLRNETGIGGRLLQTLFEYSRRRRLRRLGKQVGWIEINPLLCPLVDLLPELSYPLHVVHMVREPLSWSKSIATFRASHRIRPFFHLIPFGSPYPAPRPVGWSRLTTLEKQLWRWRCCNERIAAQREHFVSYRVVRYEDLFSDDRQLRDAAMTAILEGLDLPEIGSEWQDRYDSRVNAAPETRRKTPVDVSHESVLPASVRAICGDLMQQYGYV